MELRPVNYQNVWELLKLSVKDNQQHFVATNTESIIEAYIAITSGGHAFPFGLYDQDTPVGFLMVGYGTDEGWTDAPTIAMNNYNVWRLMIDANKQNCGYGKQAMELALQFIRTFPCGNAEYCYLSYDPENEHAKHLYASFGFKETGEMDGDEVIAAIRL